VYSRFLRTCAALVGIRLICSCATAGALRGATVRRVGTRGATRLANLVVAFNRRRLLVAAEHVTLVHPHLDADDAVGGVRLGKAVVDVGTQGVKRHAAFAIPLGTGNLGAVQTTR